MLVLFLSVRPPPLLSLLRLLCRVAASFVSQLLVTHEEGRPDFNVPPFLLTYLSTSIFTVFLPLVQLKSLLQETWLLRCGCMDVCVCWAC